MTHVGVRDNTGRFVETFEVFAKLPGPGSLAPISVRHQTTVAELKSLIELVCGIPTDLQLLSYRQHAVLTDGDTLGKLLVLPGSRLPVKTAYGYDGLVDAALRGDLKEVMRSVTMTKDADGLAKRMFVAMFIAAHKGYHYLVERMLCEGAHPDSQTPSGRTALHVACAMGNGGCLDSLLQHGASLDVQDSSGKTAAHTAAACGQQGAQRRLVLYSRIRADRAIREKPCSWSTSPRFPKSKLGSSVTPTLPMQELAISPGPELMITAWNGREHHHHFLKKRPWSAKGSLFHSDSSTSSAESWGSLREGKNHSAAAESHEDSPIPHHQTPDKNPVMTRSVHLHDRPRAAASSTSVKQNSNRAPPVKSVQFAVGETHSRPSKGMSKYSSDHSGQTFSRPPNAERHTTQESLLSLKSALRSQDNFADDRQTLASEKKISANDTKNDWSTPKRNTTKSASTAFVSDKTTVVNQPAEIGSASSDDLSSESRSQSTPGLDQKEVNSLTIDYLNDKLRAMVGLQVQHPQRLEFMKEKEHEELRSFWPTKRTRKPTPEENEQAFRDWLASKTQDARDRRLADRVGRMLDDAFGKKDETLIAGEDEDETPKKAPLKFEAWAEKKASQQQQQSAKAAAESSRQEQRKTEQLAARLGNGKPMEAWLAEKLKKRRQERIAEKERETERQRLKAEREKAVEGVFQKWCMQKEWEELQKLRGRLNSGCKRRPRSGNNKTKAHGSSAHTATRRTRAHSAPPRRQQVPPL
ncbi:ankycorbin-like [Acanthaster planci]|uniref:Ankycorbin-like n=1 Tax=Acanthaster planci TaxID=133434 RepID=A0A8B7Z031_ACAPL|nr:ankycorbin-like [Acanthaster planci]